MKRHCLAFFCIFVFTSGIINAKNFKAFSSNANENAHQGRFSADGGGSENILFDDKSSQFDGKLSGFAQNQLRRNEKRISPRYGGQQYELPDSDGKCINPLEPKNGFMFCNSNSGNEKMCRARCNPGFAFHGGERQVVIRCTYTDGTWSPVPQFPECLPIGLTPDSATFEGNLNTDFSTFEGNFNPDFGAFEGNLNPDFGAFGGAEQVSNTKTITKTITKTSSSSSHSHEGGSTHQEGELLASGSHQTFHMKCVVPPTPNQGSINCKSVNEMYKCTGRCNAGFFFPDGSQIKYLECSGESGSWAPATNFPDCEPSCEPKCENSGQCVGFNQCLCTPEYRGIACQYSISLCSGTLLDFNGDRQCDHNSDGTICIVSCPQGMSFETPPLSTEVRCDIYGTWSHSAISNCVFVDDGGFGGYVKDDFGGQSQGHGGGSHTVTKITKTSHTDQIITTGGHQSTIKTFYNDKGEMYIDFLYCPQPFGHFRHPDLCSLYLNCHDQTAFVQSCPEGQYFDDIANKCDFASKVDCGPRRIIDESTSTSTKTETVATGGSQSTITTHTDNLGMVYLDFSYCPSPTGQFPHPEICTQFLNCYNNRAYVQSCPAGLYFNDKIKGCDFPTNVNCESRLVSSSQAASHTDSSSSSSSSTFSSETYTSTIKSYVTETGETFIDFSYCPMPVGHFRHPEHCALFLNCRNQKAYVQQCPASMYFNDISNTCATKDNVDCGSRWTTELSSSKTDSEWTSGDSSKTDTLITSGSQQHTITTYIDDAGDTYLEFTYCPQPTGQFPHPEECGKFLNCYNDRAYVQSCPAGLHFNDKIKGCDYPENVKCSYTSSVSTVDVPKTSGSGSITHVGSTTFTTSIKTTIIETGETIIDFLYCTSPVGHFPHPEYCALFLNCHDRKAYVQQCPAGMFFNDLSNTCAIQATVDCGARWTDDLSATKTDSEWTDDLSATKIDSGWTTEGSSQTDTLISSGSEQSTITTHVDGAGLTYLEFTYCPQPTGQFPHPEECGKFLNCYNDRAYVQSCPAGLHFNDKIKGCDYPKNVKCAYTGSASTVHVVKTSAGLTSHTGSSTYTSTITTTTTKSGQKIIDFAFCPFPIGKYRHPEHCALFLNCHGHKAYVQQCPVGMYFNDISKTCETSTTVDCGSRWTTDLSSYWKTSEDQKTTITVYTDDSGRTYLESRYCLQPSGHFPHPELCDMFLNCDNNRAYVQPCPTGLMFNVKITGCDFAKNVDCGSRLTSDVIEVHTEYYTSSITMTIISTGETIVDYENCPAPIGYFEFEHCALFVYCHDNQAYIYRCANNHYFDGNLKTCKPKGSVDCGRRFISQIRDGQFLFHSTSDIEPLIVEDTKEILTYIDENGKTYIDFSYCPVGSRIAPHPTFCDKYLRCKENRAYVLSCGDGFLFDINGGTNLMIPCDAEKNVDCGTRRISHTSYYNSTVDWTVTSTGEIIVDYLKYCPSAFGYFPFEHCGLFVFCNNNQARVYRCENWQYFTTIARTCLPELSVACGDRFTSTLRADEFLQYGVVTRDQEEPVTAGTTIPDAGALIDFKFCEPLEGNHPHPFDCSKYINCEKKLVYVTTCPRKLLYNTKTKYCDYPENVDCGQRSIYSSYHNDTFRERWLVSETGYEESYEYYCLQPRGQFSHPYNCQWFLNCWDGRFYVQECQSNLYFNEATAQCDYPSNVDCANRPILIIDKGRDIDIDTEETEIITTVIKFGEYKQSSGKCVAWGRYHYRTFDGHIYHFNGACTYLLTKDCQDNTFSIHIVNSAGCASPFAVCQRKIIISLNSDKFVLQNGIYGIEVYENDNILTVPVWRKGLIIEYILSSVMVTHSGLGFRLFWDGDLSVVVGTMHVGNKSLKGKLCGLCGRFNDDIKDDFEMPNGEVAQTVPVFVQSWQEAPLGETCDAVKESEPSCSSNDVSLAATVHCEMILKELFRECHEIVSPKPYFESCRMDYCGCLAGAPSDCTCGTIAEYSNECNRLNSSIKIDWRTPEICALTCTSPAVYKKCGSACQATCFNDVTDCVDDLCVGGCICPTGTVLHEGKCIDRTECPCKFGTRTYGSGDTIYKDCNTCLCEKGAWKCTKQECVAVCSAIGDPHYTTFDGKHYNFMGKCSYYLLQTDKYSIIQENVACDGAISEKQGYTTLSTAFPSCTKSLTINIKDGPKVLLKQGLEVAVDDENVSYLPIWLPGMYIYQASSLFIKVQMFDGMSILWDGISRVYLEGPTTLKAKTKGLCGNYNAKQKDDFLTPDGDVETDVNAFANKWKVKSSCADMPVGDGPVHNPCNVFSHRRSQAELLCSKILSDIFHDCHAILNPETFYEDCMYDLCSCNVQIEKCLCPVIADYATACAKRHQIIDWRPQVPQCQIECSNEQTYQTCGDSCRSTCHGISLHPECKKDCVEGCNCPPGSALNANNECIVISRCPCIFENKEYEPGYKFYHNNEQCICTNAVWQCEPVDKPDPDAESLCAEEAHKKYVKCKPKCQNHCGAQQTLCAETHYENCQAGCVCHEGYVLDPKSGECWKKETCPCYHGGKLYNKGDSVVRDCNTCVCDGGEWLCGDKDCTAVCTVWGASNYQTFDGRMYDFAGDCEYVVVKGQLDAKKVFVVSIENVPCGTTGVTCSKSVSLLINNRKYKLSSDLASALPDDSGIQIVRKGLFIIVNTEIGITLYWDQKTRLYVTALPIWKTKLQGLCGNFDDDMNNDYNAPNSDIGLVKVTEFADAWKVHDYCPAAGKTRKMCDVHPSRKTWAYKRCGVLKSDLFAPCHTEVPVDPFFQSCVDDTCGCDTGGDCECMCTAIGVYAHMCNLKDIVINWRSQELCPIQCQKSCDRYTPCLSTCPLTTCKNHNSTDVQTCQSEICVEGCDPEPCPSDEVFNNVKELQCVPIDDCLLNCTLDNGKQYRNGERIIDSSINPCVTCYCKKGEVKCIGEPCTTTSSTTTPTPTTTTTPLPTTTPVPPKCQSGWSERFNEDNPFSGNGDSEIIADILDKHKFCHGGRIIDIECNSVSIGEWVEGVVSDTRLDWTKSEDVNLQCNSSFGFKCENDDQIGRMCEDYEVRLNCLCGCPDGEVWDDCAFDCRQTCHSFDRQLTGKGKCKHDNCVPGCRPEAGCHSSKVWREDKKCIAPEDCTCMRDDGTIISPGGVDEKNCSKCTCYDNSMSCLTWNCVTKKDENQTKNKTTTPVTTSSTTSTTPSTKRSIETPECWTEWVNIDKPSIGYGDFEILSDIRNQFSFCNQPVAVECRTADTQILANETNQVVHCTLENGVHCVNADNTAYGCYDYKVRFYCPCVTATTPAVKRSIKTPECWTEWVNIDKPSTGYGDFEILSELRDHFSFCDEPVAVECRAADTKVLANETNQVVHCTLENGVHCVNADNPAGCYDYEIRYYCPCECWTEWVNTDKPSTGYGDFEILSDIRNQFSICNEPAAVECRTADTHVLAGDTNQVVHCTIENGVHCVNADNTAYGCHDYEVRFYCPCEYTTTTPVTETATVPPCKQGWTEWVNSIHVTEGVDYETIQSARNSGLVFCATDTIIDMQCKPVDDTLVANLTLNGGLCDVKNGMYCSSTYEFRCTDYKVRFFCQCMDRIVAETTTTGIVNISTTQPPHCNYWSDWINNDSPVTGGGDYEDTTYSQLLDQTGFCSKGNVDAIECRSVSTNKDFKLTNDVSTACTLEDGFKCLNNHQLSDWSCEDYKIRYYCSCDLSTTTETQISTTTVVFVRPPITILPECDEFFKFIDDGYVQDSALKATSSVINYGPNMAKIESGSGWVSAADDEEPYIEIDLGRVWPIYGIETYGVEDIHSWVTSYQVWHSKDNVAIKEYLNQDGEVQVFNGNYNATAKVAHYFRKFEARYIRIKPISWKTRPALRFDVYGCSNFTTTPHIITTTPIPNCNQPLGLENFRLADSQIIVSSFRYPDFGVGPVRLNSDRTTGPGAWIAEFANYEQYVQLDFYTETVVEGITTQGRIGSDEWVTAYRVTYSHDGVVWDDLFDEWGAPLNFGANYDDDSPVTNTFKQALRTRYLRIYPTEWNNWIALRLEVIGCFEEYADGCLMPIGMQDGRIKDEWITASTFKKGCDPASARLNKKRTSYRCGGWAVTRSVPDSYIQVDMQRTANMTGVITQGRAGFDQWVNSFYVRYSDDLSSWNWAINAATDKKVFKGNFDRNTSVYNYFKTPIIGRYFRIIPLRWYKWISMRFEYLGCYVDNVTPYVSTTTTPISTTTVSTTTTDPCLSWSEWVSLSSPNPNNEGDIEPIDDIKAAVGKCSSPIKIECREPLYKTDYKVTGQVVTCDLSSGLVCLHKYQAEHGGVCYDYQVRLACYTCGPTTTTIPPPLNVCPNVTETWFCPDVCPNGLACDGKNCIEPSDCPCFIENQQIKVGNTYTTSDCRDCTCLLNGQAKCIEKSCSTSCPPDEKQVFLEDCKCGCEPCPSGLRMCPTSLECINETKWCDGIVDCPDDEKNCTVSTTTVMVDPTTTPSPPGEIWCEISNRVVKTFDDQEYEADLCDHIILADKLEKAFNITLQNTCSKEPGSDEENCKKSILINVDDVEIKIGSDLDVEFNGHTFTASQLVLLSKRRSELDISVVGNVAVFYSVKYEIEVYWDIQANLHIDLSDKMLNRVYGACGFYNGNPMDDKQKPSGEQALNTKEFIDSWSKTKGEVECPEETCPADILHSAITTCQKLLVAPFDECPSVIDAKRSKFLVQACVSNICECKLEKKYVNTEECKCDAFLPYVTECLTKLKRTSLDWRVAHNCGTQCPPPFEWSDCRPIVEQTCENYHETLSQENERCASGCFCPLGFLRKGDKCVKPNNCYDQTCSGYGDPHYTSFDGAKFTFNGNCSYILSRSTSKDLPLKIEASNGPCSSQGNAADSWFCVDELKINYGNEYIVLSASNLPHYNHRILERWEFPFHKNSINLQVLAGGTSILKIDGIDMEVMYFALNHGFRIKASSSVFNGRLEGLCGNSNFHKSDECMLRDGTVTTDTYAFATSWISSEYSRDQCYITPAEDKNLDYAPSVCDNLLDKSFGSCHALLDPADIIENCRLDVASKHKSLQTALCDNLAEYSRSCCELGVTLHDWAQKFNCTMPCRDGKVFETCRLACPATCDNYDREVECDSGYIDGCFCPEHLVEKDGVCVKPDVCEPCDDKGHIVGDEWMDGPCSRCKCITGSQIECLVQDCSPKPLCQVGEKLKLMNANDTTKCCPEFQCFKIECVPDLVPPTCKPGEVARIQEDEKHCPKYVCECDQNECPAVRWPAVLEPGQFTIIENNGCCHVVRLACKPEECPTPPSCPPRFRRTSVKGVCCDFYHCEPPVDICLYKHNYEVWNGREMSIEQELRVEAEYKPGDSWKDGLCKSCDCVMAGGLPAPHCVVDICPTPKDIEDSGEYEYQMVSLPNECCPELIRNACKDDLGYTKTVGEEWQPHNDPCTFYRCVKNKKGVKRIERKSKCHESCPAHTRYILPTAESGECCGKCVAFACVENGKVYEVGKTWESETRSCFEGTCVQQDGIIEVQYTHFSCPPLLADCPKEHLVLDDTGCCQKCNITPGECNVKSTNPNTTIGLIYLNHPDHGYCTNKKPIDLQECSGKCSSHSIFSSEESDFQHQCFCCTPKTFRLEDVYLACSDGNVVQHEIKQPVSCTCHTRCSQVGYGHSLERQTRLLNDTDPHDGKTIAKIDLE